MINFCFVLMDDLGFIDIYRVSIRSFEARSSVTWIFVLFILLINQLDCLILFFLLFLGF